MIKICIKFRQKGNKPLPQYFKLDLQSLLIYYKEELMSDKNSQQNSIKLDKDEAEKSQEYQSEQFDKSQANTNKKRMHRRQEISNFIMKTYKILEDRKNSHIIEWTDNGNCFIVKNKDLFENQILPKYFKHKKFSSFVRQLNMYDFHKIRKEKEIPIFKHKFFRMNCDQLLHKIKRKSGEEGKEEDNARMMHSQADLSYKNDDLPLKSAVSIKSKITFNVGEEIQMLTAQNQELKSNITELNKEISQFQMMKVKKQEKLVKIFSGLIYFDIRQTLDNLQERYSLRELQNHFLSEDQPVSFLEYAKRLGYIYREIYNNAAKF